MSPGGSKYTAAGLWANPPFLRSVHADGQLKIELVKIK
jgi:hypothetical protein